MPSVGQFIEWCKFASIEKYPSFETAYAQIIRYLSKQKDFRNPHEDLSKFVHHTIIHNMDFYNFQNIPIERLSYEFKIAYRATEIEIQNGNPLRVPVKPIIITEENPEPSSKEFADKAMIKIFSLFEE